MTTLILAVIVFLLTVTAILCMASALSAGKELERELKRVTEGSER